MKGIVFTSFLEMVDEMFGEEMTEDIIDSCDLPSKGAYTSVGTYQFDEMAQLATVLSQKVSIDIEKLLFTFGKYIFVKFTVYYAGKYENKKNAFEFLKSINDHIHIEVKKLYPDAELPEFSFTESSKDNMCLIYKSTRPLADFAEGMIYGCFDYYEEKIEIIRDDICNDNNKTEVHFHLKKV
ncbi:MAG: heme NO-binding domain-containing protein [Janthinobacterium lividum]